MGGHGIRNLSVFHEGVRDGAPSVVRELSGRGETEGRKGGHQGRAHMLKVYERLATKAAAGLMSWRLVILVFLRGSYSGYISVF